MFVALSFFLAFGPQALDSWLPPDWIASERIKFFITLAKKLIVFVAPSALDAIAYSIVTLAVSGVFLGIVWARTRNLFAVVSIHAATDLFPNLSDFVRTWGL